METLEMCKFEEMSQFIKIKNISNDETTLPAAETIQGCNINSTETSSSILLSLPLFKLMDSTKPTADVNETLIHKMKAVMYHDFETR